MTNLLKQVQDQVINIEKEIENISFNVFEKKNVHLMRIYDDYLNRYILQLDSEVNINKQERKNLIIKIQSIQKLIDDLLSNTNSNLVLELLINHGRNVNNLLVEKSNEIEELKLENLKLKQEILNLKKTQLHIPTLSNISDFFI